MQWMFAHKSFLDAGIRVPGASDYGPGPFEPLMALQSMVTRKDYNGNVWGPHQKVTVDEALTIATINGAYASYEEQRQGLDHRGQARRLRDARKGSARRQPRRRSRTSRSCAPSSAERRCIRSRRAERVRCCSVTERIVNIHEEGDRSNRLVLSAPRTQRASTYKCQYAIT